jgi:exodeoxyribonuclease V alpha subunit
MLDTLLASNLFQAVAPGTHVILVGDKDQLPSVGPGAVLHDLIHCGKMPVTYLTEIYRQQEGSRIITNAHAVNQGHLPDLRSVPQNTRSDFYWVEQDDPVQVAAMISRLVVERIPRSSATIPAATCRFSRPCAKANVAPSPSTPICSRRSTRLMSTNRLPVRQQALPRRRQGHADLQQLRQGRLQRRNGPDHPRGQRGQALHRAIRYRVVEYQQQEADQLLLAYAVTVHKSQGSEFPVVIMPLLSQHYVMLQRNLLYTGMTRAKKLLILVGSRRALATAVNNNTPMQRQTMLANRLG